MPPGALNSPQTADTGHMLPPHRERSGVGSIIGIIVILVLIGLGALYFWGAYLNRKDSVQQLPFIPGDNSTQEIG